MTLDKTRVTIFQIVPLKRNRVNEFFSRNLTILVSVSSGLGLGFDLFTNRPLLHNGLRRIAFNKFCKFLSIYDWNIHCSLHASNNFK